MFVSQVFWECTIACYLLWTIFIHKLSCIWHKFSHTSLSSLIPQVMAFFPLITFKFVIDWLEVIFNTSNKNCVRIFTKVVWFIDTFYHCLTQFIIKFATYMFAFCNKDHDIFHQLHMTSTFLVWRNLPIFDKEFLILLHACIVNTCQ